MTSDLITRFGWDINTANEQDLDDLLDYFQHSNKEQKHKPGVKSLADFVKSKGMATL